MSRSSDSHPRRDDPPTGGGDLKRIFVYGTLKRGHSRSPVLQKQRFLGSARTVAKYRMYDCGSFPGLAEDSNGREIQGELWEVDRQCLKRIDEIEGVAQNLYERRPVQLAPPHDKVSAQSYFYQRDVSGLPDCGVRW